MQPTVTADAQAARVVHGIGAVEDPFLVIRYKRAALATGPNSWLTEN